MVLYAKNGDTVMTTASVTSLAPYVYQWTGETRGKRFLATCAENLGPYVTQTYTDVGTVISVEHQLLRGLGTQTSSIANVNVAAANESKLVT